MFREALVVKVVDELSFRLMLVALREALVVKFVVELFFWFRSLHVTDALVVAERVVDALGAPILMVWPTALKDAESEMLTVAFLFAEPMSNVPWVMSEEPTPVRLMVAECEDCNLAPFWNVSLPALLILMMLLHWLPSSACLLIVAVAL